mmetsp:Transcript_91275/g.263383  ORF Transcript_91275/g.263383 Transcript_91275/m.263383 type:complete len:287 (-) Transcript_91275:306-1166(-)
MAASRMLAVHNRCGPFAQVAAMVPVRRRLRHVHQASAFEERLREGPLQGAMRLPFVSAPQAIQQGAPPHGSRRIRGKARLPLRGALPKDLLGDMQPIAVLFELDVTPAAQLDGVQAGAQLVEGVAQVPVPVGRCGDEVNPIFALRRREPDQRILALAAHVHGGRRWRERPHIGQTLRRLARLQPQQLQTSVAHQDQQLSHELAPRGAALRRSPAVEVRDRHRPGAAPGGQHAEAACPLLGHGLVRAQALRGDEQFATRDAQHTLRALNGRHRGRIRVLLQHPHRFQ